MPKKWKRGRPKLRWEIVLKVASREWESGREKKLETADRERSKKKVRGRKKTMGF